MNKIILMGRLTRDPEVRYSQGNDPMAIARYTLAVDKKKKRDDGITADFFRIVAFDKLAEFAEKYLQQGTKILLSGHVQTGTYEKDGIKMPFFEVVVEEQEFAESKNANQGNTPRGNSSTMDSDGFMNIPDDMEELPFNEQEEKTGERKRVRLLRSDGIECRIGTVSDKGLSLLLYKDARADMKILDEVFGPMGWKRQHV